MSDDLARDELSRIDASIVRCDCQGRPLPTEDIERTRVAVVAAADNGNYLSLAQAELRNEMTHVRLVQRFDLQLDPQELALALYRCGARLLVICGEYCLPTEQEQLWADRLLRDPTPGQVQQAGYEIWLDMHNARLAARKCWLHSADY